MTTTYSPAETDEERGALLRALREARGGLSPEEMPRAMRLAGVPKRNIPSGKTIRRCEDPGALPHVRFRFGLAKFFNRPYHEIWGGHPVESEDEAAAT